MEDKLNPMPPSQPITDIRESRDNDPKQKLPDQAAQGGSPISGATVPGTPKIGNI